LGEAFAGTFEAGDAGDPFDDADVAGDFVGALGDGAYRDDFDVFFGDSFFFGHEEG